MRSTLVRGAAVVSAAALALSLALGVPSAQAATIPAPTGADPAPAAGAAAYLASEVQANNLLRTTYGTGPSDFYDDYGLTIDAAYALDAVGGQTAKLTAMTNALEAAHASYYNAFSGTGAAAKLSAFLQSQGRTGTVVDDLVTAVEGHIATLSPLTGRLVDPDDPGTPYDDDFNSPLTQAFAVNALNNAGSDEANAALTYLLKQQCSEGFFQAAFPAKAAADQSCNGAATKTPSIDYTGLAVLMLQDQKSKPVVSSAITKALDWLVSQQQANGSFTGSSTTNTDGLAGWALGVGGRTAAAAKTALWLRSNRQLADAGSCKKYAAADHGAVVVDASMLSGAGTAPLDAIDTSLAVRATAQAAPALLWSPGGAAAGDTTLMAPKGFVPAGSAQTVTLKGAPGNTVCVSTGGAGTRLVLDANGAGSVATTAPATTGKVTVTATDAGGETDTASFTALAAAELTVKAKKSVHKGAKVAVKVSGLEAGEDVTVKAGGKTFEETADASGKVKVKVAAAKAGKLKIKATGAFANRKGKATVTVKA